MAELLCEHLQEPWGNKLRSLFAGLEAECRVLHWDDITICSGQVEEICEDTVTLDLFTFRRGSGFIPDEKVQTMKIHIPGFRSRAFACARKCHITCAGRLSEPMSDTSLSFCSDVVLQHRPELQIDMPWDAIHLFCGAFDGWSRALQWLAKSNLGFSLRREVHIDSSEEVMDTWAYNHDGELLHAPLEPCRLWDVRKSIGVVGCVSDRSVLHVVESQANLLSTASPPCVSWSRGGKSRGLACDEGWAFVQSIVLSFVSQANLIALECADELDVHPHAPLIDRLLSALGYILIWKQVVPFQLISHSFRTRWLSVWARASDPSKALPFVFNLADVPRTPWFDPAYTFDLPPVLAGQLHLSADERRIYGDRDFLPPAKKAKCDPSASVSQVLQARVTSCSEPLPTLCASYSTQHQLDPGHLREKGIFAFLICPPWTPEPVFAEPTRCACLLGSPSAVSMPLDVRRAFHHLGNAISVPQALLAVGIGLTSVSCLDKSVLRCVKNCWGDRLTCTNAILVQGDDFWTLMPCRDAIPLVPSNLSVPPFSGFTVSFWIKLSHTAEEYVSVPCHWTFRRFLLQVLTTSASFVDQVSLVSDAGRLCLCSPVDSLQNSRELVSLCLRETQFGLLSRVAPPEDKVPPTQPFLTCDEMSPTETVDFRLQSVDSFLDSSSCIRTLRLLESFDPGEFRTRKHEAILAVAPFSLVIRFPVAPVRISDQLNHIAKKIGDHPWEVQRSLALPPWIRGPVYVLSEPLGERASILFAIENEPATLGVQLVDSPMWSQTQIQVCNKTYRIHQHNGLDVVAGTLLSLDQADFLSLKVIAAGGHHANGPPPLLKEGTSFINRCHFVEETHGWLATDEMIHAVRQLQWRCPAFATFVGPAIWDTAGEVWHTLADALVFRRGLRTIVPILIDNHWCAIDVNRKSSQILVNLVGIHHHLGDRIRRILAQLMSEQEDSLFLQSVSIDPTPHMCGWNLIYEWFSECAIIDGLQDLLPTIRHLPLSVRIPVNTAMQASVRFWRAASGRPVVWHLAHRLRQNHLCELAISASAAGMPVPQTLVTNAASYVQVAGPVPCPPFEDELRRRLSHFDNHAGWLASDELDFILQQLRFTRHDIRFLPPAAWNSRSGTLRYFQSLKPVCTAFPCCIWFVLVDRHWIQIELQRHGDTTSLYITAPRSHADLVFPLRVWFARLLCVSVEQILVFHVFQTTPDGLCGWSLIYNLFVRCGATAPVFTPAHAHALTLVPCHDHVRAIRHEAAALWNSWTPNSGLTAFAFAWRSFFLLHVAEGRIAPSYAAGGTNSTPPPQQQQDQSSVPAAAAAASSTNTDPLWHNDPWARKPQKRVHTKWEDLTLPKDHPFVDNNSQTLQQTHRLKADVLATRAALSDILSISTKKTLGVLLPVTDLAAFGNLAAKITGPHEVVLDDVNLQSSYKRLALLLPVFGSIKYQLAPAAHSCTAAEYTEVVLELDSRLLAPKDFTHATESPIQTFRKILQSIHSGLPDTLTLYGLRKGRHPSASKEDTQLQCMARVPKSARQSILEKSGVHGLLIRDFLERGQSASDATVLPRFWAPTCQDLHDMLIITANVTGNAGLVLTKRGLALRVWVDKIGEARKAILADDPRIIEENLNIIPRVILESTGWPTAIDAPNVVRSTHKATGKAPIPTKAFRSAGVHGWTLAFQERPAKTRFTIQINSSVHEILLSEPQGPAPKQNRVQTLKAQKQAKGQKPPEPSAPSLPSFPPAVQKHAESERIDRLEAKMSQLDARQTSLETQLHTRFDDVGVQLQKILSSVQPNTRQRAETEGSPPTKPPKYQP